MRSVASGGQCPAAQEVRYQMLGVVFTERLEEDRRGVELAAAPARPPLEQLGSREAQDHDRSATRQVGHVLDEIEERRLCPVEVVEHDHQRAATGDGLEEPSGGPEDFLARASFRAPEAQRLGEAGDHKLRLGVPGELRRDGGGRRFRGALLVGHVPDDLGQGPVGDALAIGQAAATQHARLVTEPRRGSRERGATFPRPPRRARVIRRHVRSLTAAANTLERVSKCRSRPTSGESKAGGARDGFGMHLDDPKGGDRLSTPGRVVSGPIGRDRASDQIVRQLVDEDLTVCGQLLETLGDVDGFSGHKRLAGGGAGGDGLPRADSETGGKAEPRRCAPAHRGLLRRASRISLAARTARRASSSWRSGTPKTAISASPG